MRCLNNLWPRLQARTRVCKARYRSKTHIIENWFDIDKLYQPEKLKGAVVLLGFRKKIICLTIVGALQWQLRNFFVLQTPAAVNVTEQKKDGGMMKCR